MLRPPSGKGGVAWPPPRQHVRAPIVRRVRTPRAESARRIIESLKSIPFHEYQPAVRDAPCVGGTGCNTRIREVQGPQSTRKIERYDRGTDFKVNRCARSTVISVPRDALWFQPAPPRASVALNDATDKLPWGSKSFHNSERSVVQPKGRLDRRIERCGHTKQSLQARLLAQVADKLAMQPHSGSTRALIGREEQAGAHRFGKVGEETQTRKFLGRMRAAVATDDRVPGPDEGQQIWSDKEAIAHSLYSRRLQMVEDELASLQAGKAQLAAIIAELLATNNVLESDVRQLPPLINKVFQMESNLLLRGKDAAGVWPCEPQPKQPVLDFSGELPPGQGLGEIIDRPINMPGDARRGQGGEGQGVCREWLEEENAKRYVLAAGRHRARVPLSVVARNGAASGDVVCSKVPGRRDGETELIVRDGLKEHLHKSLLDLSELVGGIRMPPPSSAPGPHAEGSESGLSEGGPDASRLVDREDGDGSRLESGGEGRMERDGDGEAEAEAWQLGGLMYGVMTSRVFGQEDGGCVACVSSERGDRVSSAGGNSAATDAATASDSCSRQDGAAGEAVSGAEGGRGVQEGACGSGAQEGKDAQEQERSGVAEMLAALQATRHVFDDLQQEARGWTSGSADAGNVVEGACMIESESSAGHAGGVRDSRHVSLVVGSRDSCEEERGAGCRRRAGRDDSEVAMPESASISEQSLQEPVDVEEDECLVRARRLLACLGGQSCA